MAALSVVEPADCELLYDIDALRYDEQWMIEHKIERHQIVSVMQSYRSLGFLYDGKPIGGVMYDGKEAHMAVLPEYHGRWGFLLKPMMEWLFAIKEPMQASVEISNTHCVRFMDRNKWRRVASNDKYITFEARRRPERSRLG